MASKAFPPPFSTVEQPVLGVVRQKFTQLYSLSSHPILGETWHTQRRIGLTENERMRLEEMARSRLPAARKVLRAKIILRRAEGESFRDIGTALSCDLRSDNTSCDTPFELTSPSFSTMALNYGIQT